MTWEPERTFPENLLRIVLFHQGTNKLKSISLMQLDVFSEDILFSLPRMQTVSSIAITFQGFGGNFNYCGMLLCIHLFLFHFVFYCNTKNPHSVFGRETLAMCSLTLVLLQTPGHFQVVSKLFGRVSHPGVTGTSFSTFSVLMIFWRGLISS